MTINHIVKNILSALAVSFFGFVLWNLTFVLYALFVRLIILVIPIELFQNARVPMSSLLVVFFLIIAILTWYIFRSRLPDLVKAVWLTAPLVIVLVAVGMLTYQIPWLTYGLGAAVLALVLICLRLTKRPWIYYYAAFFTVITLLIFNLSGGEI